MKVTIIYLAAFLACSTAVPARPNANKDIKETKNSTLEVLNQILEKSSNKDKEFEFGTTLPAMSSKNPRLPSTTESPWDQGTTGNPWNQESTSYPWDQGTTGNPWNQESTRYPWDQGTTGNPWNQESTRYPWDQGTTGNPWNQESTRYPWDQGTTGNPWNQESTRYPWDQGTTGNPWNQESTRYPWNEGTTGNPWNQESTRYPWGEPSTRNPWNTGTTYYNDRTTTSYEEPTPTPDSDTINGPGCINDPRKAWSDVMFVVESAGSDKDTFQNMWLNLVAMTSKFNIQRHGFPFNNYMQVGIVVYSEKSKVVAELGTVTDMASLPIPFNESNSTEVNLEDALEKAIGQLNGPNARRNSPKIIYVLADDYNNHGFSDPKTAANHFKKAGNIVITKAIKPNNGAVPFGLEEIASPGYYLDQYTTVDDESSAILDANCFCPQGAVPFDLLGTVRKLPTSGCYVPINLSYTFRTANMLCKQKHNANIVSIKTPAKSSFVLDLLPGQLIWIGLSNNFGVLTWPDGSRLGQYHPWYNTAPNSNQNVYMATNYLWMSANPQVNTPHVVCELAPCSSGHYCS